MHSKHIPYKYVCSLLKKVWALLVVVCLACAGAHAQDTLRLQLLRTLPDSLQDFEVDNLGKLYLINHRQQLKKLEQNFDSLGVYNDVRQFGKLHSIDVSNPLKVLLYFRDFGTIVVLDRFLNVRTVLDIRKSDILQASAITQSYDNHIWLYDELDNKVKKIDESGRVLLESPDFRVLFEEPPQPYRLEDHNRFLYAYDSNLGLLVMDYFGAYKNMIPFKGWQNLHGIQQGIAATHNGKLLYYKPGSVQVQESVLPRQVSNALKIRVQGNRLYALNQQKRLQIFQIQH